MTLENHIYINPAKFKGGVFDPSRRDDYDVLLEEAIHAGQFQTGMTRPGYLWEALVHGYEGSIYENKAWDIVRQGDAPSPTLPRQNGIDERPLDE
ncbi:MAG: hypothetical protein ACLGQW_02055 [Acidobacteriota bacterium]